LNGFDEIEWPRAAPAETAARQKPELHTVLPLAGMASNLAPSLCGSCSGGSGNTLVHILEIKASKIPASAVDAADDTVLGKFIVEHERGIADLMWGGGVKPSGCCSRETPPASDPMAR